MRPTTTLALAAGCLLCCADGDVRNLQWRYTLEVSAETLEATILRGGCGASERVHADSFRPGAADALTPPDLGAGLYGFAIVARDGACGVVGRGCEELRLPAAVEQVVTVVEAAPGPACERCVDGFCASFVDAGPTGDMAVSSDLGPADAFVPPDAPSEVVDMAPACPLPCLVGHYRLDEAPGATAADSSEFGHDATAVGFRDPSSIPGRVGQAFDFERDRLYRVVSDDGHLDFADDGFSLSFWVLSEHTPVARVTTVLGVQDASDTLRLGVQLVDAASPTSATDPDSVFEIDFVFQPDGVRESGALADGWHHVVVVWQPSAELSVWVDGSPLGAPGDRTLTFPISLAFGGYYDAGNTQNSTSGAIDELRVYRGLLSPEDIGALGAP